MAAPRTGGSEVSRIQPDGPGGARRGLTIAINQRFETFAPIVSTVVLAAVAIFEMVWPISAVKGGAKLDHRGGGKLKRFS